MTREQALNYLKSSGMTEEQIETVVDALTCEDAVSKHAVLETIDSRIEQIKRDADAINKSYSHLSYAEGVYNGYCRLKCDLWDLPSVTLLAEPCEDCISRTTLLAKIDEERKHLLALKMDGAEHIIVHHARRIIEDMPTVTPKAEWIPVTEKLPEKSGKYLVTVKNGNVYAGTFDAFSGQFQCAATAWQALPTPYEVESED